MRGRRISAPIARLRELSRRWIVAGGRGFRSEQRFLQSGVCDELRQPAATKHADENSDQSLYATELEY